MSTGDCGCGVEFCKPKPNGTCGMCGGWLPGQAPHVGTVPRTCGRLMVGSGSDSYDPTCELRAGHSGSCKSTQAIDQHRIFPHGRIPASDGRVQRESTGGDASRLQSVIERPPYATEIRGVRHAGEGRAAVELEAMACLFRTHPWGGR